MGYEEIVDIFLGSLQNWTIFGESFLYISELFLKIKVQNGNIVLG